MSNEEGTHNLQPWFPDSSKPCPEKATHSPLSPQRNQGANPPTPQKDPIWYNSMTATERTLMKKELVKDEAVLTTPCSPATADDADVAQDLVDTLTAMDDAACLAANQIGVTKSLFAYVDEQNKPHVMYNPCMKLGLGASKVMEGCLTREGETKVTRFERIKVTYDELVNGKLVARKRDFTGWTAQLIQHMIDHCKGKLV